MSSTSTSAGISRFRVTSCEIADLNLLKITVHDIEFAIFKASCELYRQSRRHPHRTQPCPECPRGCRDRNRAKLAAQRITRFAARPSATSPSCPRRCRRATSVRVWRVMAPVETATQSTIRRHDHQKVCLVTCHFRPAAAGAADIGSAFTCEAELMIRCMRSVHRGGPFRLIPVPGAALPPRPFSWPR